MIIQNGFISIKHKTAGGIDMETGYPIASTDVEWGDPVPCQYVNNSNNLLGRYDGEHFTVASYVIYIEQAEEPFAAEQIRLTDMDGNLVRDYSVMEIEPLDAVCEVRLLV